MKIFEEFFEFCWIDVCLFEGVNLDVVKCEVVEVFVEECVDNGVIVMWRSIDFCCMCFLDVIYLYIKYKCFVFGINGF